MTDRSAILEHCSFCGCSADRAKALVAGPQHVYICDACIELCRKTIDEAHRPLPPPDRDVEVIPDNVVLWMDEASILLLELHSRFRSQRSSFDTSDLTEQASRRVKAVERTMQGLDVEFQRAIAELAYSRMNRGSPIKRQSMNRHSPDRRGPRLAPVTDMFVASDDVAQSLPVPPSIVHLPAVGIRGLTPMVLLDIAEVVIPQLRNDDKSEFAMTPPGDYPSPWVAPVPASLLFTLTKLQESDLASIARSVHTRACVSAAGWSLVDLDYALHHLRRLAISAEADKARVWLWIDP